MSGTRQRSLIAADEEFMQRMEAEGDRKQTIRDERNKVRAREAMQAAANGTRIIHKWTKEEIQEKLDTNLKWLERAVVAIFKQQTRQEQDSEKTLDHNNRGFNGVDAHLGTYLARWILSGRHLSDKWVDKARKIMVKYAGQLAKIANGGL